MFWNNVIKIIIVGAVLALFCTIFFHLYRKVEGFVGTQQEQADLFSRLETTIKPITDRLCPIFIGVQTTIAKNAMTTANTNPTEGEASRAAKDAAAGKATPMNSPQPSPEDMQKAFRRMLLEAQHLLISCPLPADVTTLPPTIATDLTNTLIYLNTKITNINTQLNSSLDGNLATTNPNDVDDLYSTMSLAQKQNYTSILAQYSSNITPRTVQLTEVELDALLQQRISTLTTVKNQVDVSGNNYVQGYLASIERGYKDLQKTQSGNLKPGPNVMSGVPSS
jgi:flagellin-specific chaperone FliS